MLSALFGDEKKAYGFSDLSDGALCVCGQRKVINISKVTGGGRFGVYY